MAFKRWELKKKWKDNGDPFSRYKEVTYYDYHEVDELIEKLNNLGYDCRQTYEGCLGSGNWICLAPDEAHYNYVITEVALNSWSSAHRIERRMKLRSSDLEMLRN